MKPTLTEEEMSLVLRIADRAVTLYAKNGQEVPKLHVVMDITAAHMIQPLRLEDLAEATDFDFMHDVSGIDRHLDRRANPVSFSGFFLPRFSRGQ